MKRRKIDLAQAARPTPARGSTTGCRWPPRCGGLLNKVFPDHWSFLLGEIALFSFIILLLTGTFLTLFFDPSMKEVTYDGAYTPLRGIADVRGVRVDAWTSRSRCAAACSCGRCTTGRRCCSWRRSSCTWLRIFFTGAFRKPRETNWIIGVAAVLARLPGRLHRLLAARRRLSGTGLRIASAIMLSIPVVGTWVAASVFGGEFPGHLIIGRFYIAARAAHPGRPARADQRPPGPGLQAEAHPVARPRRGPTTTWSASACSRGTRSSRAASSWPSSA